MTSPWDALPPPCSDGVIRFRGFECDLPGDLPPGWMWAPDSAQATYALVQRAADAGESGGRHVGGSALPSVTGDGLPSLEVGRPGGGADDLALRVAQWEPQRRTLPFGSSAGPGTWLEAHARMPRSEIGWRLWLLFCEARGRSPWLVGATGVEAWE